MLKKLCGVLTIMLGILPLIWRIFAESDEVKDMLRFYLVLGTLAILFVVTTFNSPKEKILRPLLVFFVGGLATFALGFLAAGVSIINFLLTVLSDEEYNLESLFYLTLLTLILFLCGSAAVYYFITIFIHQLRKIRRERTTD